jgi:hypothetical protein
VCQAQLQQTGGFTQVGRASQLLPIMTQQSPARILQTRHHGKAGDSLHQGVVRNVHDGKRSEPKRINLCQPELAHLVTMPAMQGSCTSESDCMCFAMPCCAMLCYAMLCYAVLCCAMLCCAMLCCAVLCCAVLCYAVL